MAGSTTKAREEAGATPEGETSSSLLRETLRKQVQDKMVERGLVVWLDREGLYTDFVDELIALWKGGKFFAPVMGYRGSYLETIFQLDGHQDGLDPTPMLLHVPGHTDQTIRTTPLLEAYKSGVRFERSLETLVREVAAGLAAPDATEEFLKLSELTFANAEGWLSQQQTGEVSDAAVFLQNLKPEWVLDSLVQKDRELFSRFSASDGLQALRDYLARYTGFSQEFDSFFHGGSNSGEPGPLADAFLGWLLCVEYVHDLSRPPQMAVLQPLVSLSGPLKKASLKLCGHFRDRHQDAYREVARQTETMVEQDLKFGTAEELGKIDTFSREDSRLLRAAIEALMEERWGQALEWSTSRLHSPSVWINHEQLRRQEWMLVKVAAELGKSLTLHPRPLEKVVTLAGAVETYAGRHGDGAQWVDRAHRSFEQEQSKLLVAKLTHFGLLQEAASRLRRLYRRWADQLGRDFATLCAQQGYLPEPRLQQRNLYEQEVHPRTQGSQTVAFFLVDALRYEMAQELADKLKEKDTRVYITPRLAELPSITSVGMNVLAPVCQDGKLTVEGRFKGFRAGEYAVSSNQNRLRAMGERSLERHPAGRKTPVSFKLQELRDTARERLRAKVKESSLIVVHSREIDESGESDVGLTTFDRWIGHLRSAVQQLHAAGVEEFVITADHGFLLLDASAPPFKYGGNTPDRRWVLTDSFESYEDLDTVSMDALGYQGQSGHLLFLRDSQVFDTKGQSARTFVHGGNSLQERVIPVLTVSYAKKHTDISLNQYRIEAEVLKPVMGCSRVELKLLKTNIEEGLLDFAEGEKITVAFRVLNQPGEVIIKDAPEVEMVNQQLLLEAGKKVEVYFTLHGSGDPKAPIEIYHPDGLKRVEPCRPGHFFPVDVKATTTASKSDAGHETVAWVDNLPEKIRDVFLHIEEYGSITESEVNNLLGSPRKTRKFGSNFDKYVKFLPFNVEIEAQASGKRWNKV